HKKARNDANMGKIFNKIGREIVVAVKAGGPDIELNRRLKDVILKAKSNNMPNDTIERAIKRASGDGSDIIYEDITYEGYGPYGVAVIVESLTDNKNRTAANIRHAFAKYGGNMGTTGCVSFMFDRVGQISIEKSDDLDEDELLMLALEAGADDMKIEEEGYTIITSVDNFSEVNDGIVDAGINVLSAEITMIPQTTTEITDPEEIKNIENMLDHLEEDDDVQDVYHNWEEME
ncbi:MAG: YebC/PmpR family DNA-binding transcriptional regulator, partial [Vallitaleaceae bacterium]|nr:YebC/PmpR family DNA-binding transcriptional regulator [Vallitaleaceae bacterium]